MAPPKGGNVNAVLANFRRDQVKAAKVVADAAKEREERLKKVAAGGVKKPAAPRPSRSRAKTTTSSGPGGSDAGPSGSGAPAPGAAPDWRTAVARPSLPLGMRQKQVVDFLRKHEAPATAAQIATATGRDVVVEVDLAAALDANPKVEVDADAGTFAYLPDANVRNREQLLDYVRRAGAPVAVSEIADAYKTIMDDVAALKADGLVTGLHSFDPEVGCEVLFAVDGRLAGLETDAEVAALWAATELPDDDEGVAEELRKVGQTPAPRKAPRKRGPRDEKKKKARKAARLRAVTNAHLMHLLEGEGPTAIDAPIE